VTVRPRDGWQWGETDWSSYELRPIGFWGLWHDEPAAPLRQTTGAQEEYAWDCGGLGKVPCVHKKLRGG
jgi:hypothetical protein